MTTQEVFKHHVEAFSKGDVEEVMKDYDNNSVLITNEYTAKGLDEIRDAFTRQFSVLFAPGTYEMTPERIEVVGEVAFISWSSKNQNAEIPLGTDTLIVQNGIITTQTFAALVNKN